MPNFVAHLYPLGDAGALKAKCHAVREAILQQIKSDDRKRPHLNGASKNF
jgi:hypothetical protein